MKKKLILGLFALVTIGTTTLAIDGDQHEANQQRAEATEKGMQYDGNSDIFGSFDGELDFDEDGEFVVAEEMTESNDNPWKGGRALTGLEYENTTFKKSDYEIDALSYIVFDGHYQFNENWSVLFWAKNTHVTKTLPQWTPEQGEFNTEEKEQATSFEVIPRYQARINDNMAWGLQTGVETSGVWSESDVWRIKPDVSFFGGKHFLNLNVIHGKELQTGTREFETEPLYVYNVSPKFSVGFKAFYFEAFNDFNYTEKLFKPLVQFRFDNSAYLELRYEIGTIKKNGGGDSAYRHIPALYTEFPLPLDGVRGLIEVKYTYDKDRIKSEYGWGDSENLFVKAGVVWTF